MYCTDGQARPDVFYKFEVYTTKYWLLSNTLQGYLLGKYIVIV